MCSTQWLAEPQFCGKNRTVSAANPAYSIVSNRNQRILRGRMRTSSDWSSSCENSSPPPSSTAQVEAVSVCTLEISADDPGDIGSLGTCTSAAVPALLPFHVAHVDHASIVLSSHVAHCARPSCPTKTAFEQSRHSLLQRRPASLLHPHAAGLLLQRRLSGERFWNKLSETLSERASVL